jgi:hypothetical protein
MVVGPHALGPLESFVCLLEGYRGIRDYLGSVLRLRIGGAGLLECYGRTARCTAASDQAANDQQASPETIPNMFPYRLAHCVLSIVERLPRRGIDTREAGMPSLVAW